MTGREKADADMYLDFPLNSKFQALSTKVLSTVFLDAVLPWSRYNARDTKCNAMQRRLSRRVQGAVRGWLNREVEIL